MIAMIAGHPQPQPPLPGQYSYTRSDIPGEGGRGSTVPAGEVRGKYGGSAPSGSRGRGKCGGKSLSPEGEVPLTAAGFD